MIELTERLFFELRDFHQSTAWINIHVISPELKDGCYERAVQYRQAYWGGARVAKRIIETGKGISDDSTGTLIEQQQLLQMKCLAALETPLLNSEEAIRFLRISLDFQHRMARLQFERAKFSARAEQELRKHEFAERRRHEAERRFEQESQTTQQKKDRRQKVKSDRQRLASIQASLDRQWQYSENQKRIERANHSPLAGLLWTHITNTRSVTREASAPQDDNQYVAA